MLLVAPAGQPFGFEKWHYSSIPYLAGAKSRTKICDIIAVYYFEKGFCPGEALDILYSYSIILLVF